MIRQKPLASIVQVPARQPPLKEVLATPLLWFSRYLIYWLVPISIVIAWHAIVAFGLVEERNLPYPLTVVRTALEMISSGEFVRDVAVSALRAFGGLLS